MRPLIALLIVLASFLPFVAAGIGGTSNLGSSGGTVNVGTLANCYANGSVLPTFSPSVCCSNNAYASTNNGVAGYCCGSLPSCSTGSSIVNCACSSSSSSGSGSGSGSSSGSTGSSGGNNGKAF